MLVVFITLDNGLMLPVVVVKKNPKYFCLFLKRRHFVLPLNECKNANVEIDSRLQSSQSRM